MTDGECSGFATSCSSLYSSYSCTLQEGCYYSSSSSTCSGVASSCTFRTSSYDCTSQEGCRWSASCSGTPWTCDGLVVSVCMDIPGCTAITAD
jgi:hypothetical protein